MSNNKLTVPPPRKFAQSEQKTSPLESPKLQPNKKSEDQMFIEDLLKEDKEQVKKYVANLLADIRSLRQENKKLRKENELNSLVQSSYKSDLNESKREYMEKIKKLEERNKEMEDRLKGIIKTVKPY